MLQEVLSTLGTIDICNVHIGRKGLLLCHQYFHLVDAQKIKPTTLFCKIKNSTLQFLMYDRRALVATLSLFPALSKQGVSKSKELSDENIRDKCPRFLTTILYEYPAPSRI